MPAEPHVGVLTNTTPLIALAQVGLFPLLRALYGHLSLPPAVYREVVTEGRGRAGAQETAEAVTMGWLEVLPLRQPEAAQRLRAQLLLGDGESEVLALAQEHQVTLVLLDEDRAVRHARALRLPVLRTVGVLLQAKTQLLLPDVKPPLDTLRTLGFRLSEGAYQQALRYAGEAP
jgi:predicted nucleic acid-binding protein